MNQIERIQALLCSRGITSEQRENGTELSTSVFAGLLGARLIIGERKGVLHCSVLLPVFCPDYRRAEMAEAVCRANWGLMGGSFRLDMADGELRFESFLPLLDGEPTDEQLHWLIFGSWNAAKRYAMAVTEVAVSAATPEAAINRAEASWQEEQRETAVA